MHRIKLREETGADETFLRNLYTWTRSDEMALTSWTDEQKSNFLNQQFDLQRHHYRTYYSDADFFVVLVEACPIGRWYLHRGDECFLLLDVALLPEHRGLGMGEYLLKTLLAEASAAEKPVRLHVESFNRAQNLYVRLGFYLVENQGIHKLMEWVPHIPQ